MSTSSPRRLLTGLAAAALIVGLVGAPLVAYADPTPTPSPTVSAAEAQSPTPLTESPSAPDSPTSSSSVPSSPTVTASPSDTESPSGTPSSSSESTVDESSSTSPATGTTARVAQNAIEVPGPSESPAPSIAFAKSASRPSVSAVGQVITYGFVATNNGSVALNNVAVTDELEGLSALACTRPAPVTLQPTEVLRCSATLPVTQAVLDFGDINNVATVDSEPVGGNPDDSGDNAYNFASAIVRVVQSPSIALRASVSPTGTADRGDRLRYTGTATNTGNVTLTAARITSSLSALDLDCEPSSRATLAPGASVSCAGSYRVSAADARRGRVSTKLTARAERPFGDTSSGSDDVTDAVRLRVAVTKPAATADHGLADTGGPALPLGLAGLAAVGGGLVLLRRSRRA